MLARPIRSPVTPPTSSDLLIIECDSASLAADRLNLGSLFYQLLSHDIAKLFFANKKIVLLKTSTRAKLNEQFAEALERHGRFRAVLVVGHSNPEGIRVAHDEFLEWRVFGHWLAPFAPELIFLAACEAGKSTAVRDLFEPLKATLCDVYACPVKLYPLQAASFAVLIASLLWTGDIDENDSTVAQLLNYVTTGGQIYRWSYDETGAGAQIPAKSWDDLSKALDFGPWDLHRQIDDWIQGVRRNS